jgi:hypothetical protein
VFALSLVTGQAFRMERTCARGLAFSPSRAASGEGFGAIAAESYGVQQRNDNAMNSTAPRQEAVSILSNMWTLYLGLLQIR